MKCVTIEAIEDLLSIPEEVTSMQIGPNVIIRYLYDVKKCGRQDENINIDALKNLYMESINQAYNNNKHLTDITFSKEDLEKIRCR